MGIALCNTLIDHDQSAFVPRAIHTVVGLEQRFSDFAKSIVVVGHSAKACLDALTN